MIGDENIQPSEGADPLSELTDALVPEQEEGQRDARPEAEEPEEEEQEPDETEEEDEEESDEGEEPAKKKFTLKHEGKEVELELTPDEEVAMLQKSFDYSQKTMAVAEDRKAVQAERERIVQTRTQVDQHLSETINRLQAFSQYMEANVGQPPDVSLLDYDTAGYLRQKEQYEARRGQFQQAYAAIQHIQDEQARQRQAWIAERAADAERVLADTLPGWSDNTLNELSGYAKTFGVTPNEAAEAMLSPGFWQLIHKAKAFDAIQAKKAEMKPTQKLARVAKPTAVNTSGKVAERAKREAAFNKNPSVDALADLLR